MEKVRRLVFDLSSIQGESGYRGIGRVAWEIISRLIKVLDKSWKIHGILCSHLDTQRGLQIRENILSIREDIEIEIFESSNFSNYFNILSEQPEWVNVYEITLEYFISQLKPHIYFNPSHFECDHPTSLKKLKGSWYDWLIIYDLIPYLFPEFYLSFHPQDKWYYQKLKEVNAADFYFAISETTKSDFVNYLSIAPEKIEVTYLDASTTFRKLNEEDKKKASHHLKQKFNLESFILYVSGGFDYRKNLHTLFKAFALLPYSLKRVYKLVIASKVNDEIRKNLYKLAKDSGIDRGKIVLTDFVSDEELNMLYNLTSLFVYPSLYEGFGLPVLEAMRAGAPVLGSNSSSIKEIISIEDAMFNPENAEDMAGKIIKALTYKNYRDFLINNSEIQQKRFSWEKTVQRIATILEETFHD